MIGEWIRFGLCAVFMLAGLFIVVVSLIGLYRFDFALNRIHAAAMADTLSLLLFTVGIHAVVWKLVLVVVVQWLTSPLSSHMLSMFEYRADFNLADHVDMSDAEYHTEEAAEQ